MRDLEHYELSRVEKRGYLKTPMGTCRACGGDIYLGEEYITDGYFAFHTDCLFLKEAKGR